MKISTNKSPRVAPSHHDISSKELRPIFRFYRPQDKIGVIRLLHNLASAYPGGDEWLIKRLTDVENGKANCTIVALGRSIIGVAIETPKPENVVKLSNLFVSEEHRSEGLGSLLLESLKLRWRETGVAKVIGTYDATTMPSLGYFLQIHGFKQIALKKDRYWIGHSEAVVEWIA